MTLMSARTACFAARLAFSIASLFFFISRLTTAAPFLDACGCGRERAWARMRMAYTPACATCSDAAGKGDDTC